MNQVQNKGFSGQNEKWTGYREEGTEWCRLFQKEARWAARVCFAADEEGVVIHEWRAGWGVGKLMDGKERF